MGAGLKLLNHLQVGANYNIPLGDTADIEGTDASYKTKTWQVSVAYIFLIVCHFTSYIKKSFR